MKQENNYILTKLNRIWYSRFY